jgi:UDP-2-acetamido-3-amino-2,3-dideoxy-glucuronate N-acetyltransferase
MNDHIAVAVVGCGYWGKNLVRNFHQLGRLRVICDVDQAQLEKLQQQYEGVDISTSYEEVLRRQDVEGIVIAAPAEQHYSLAKRALEMGKDVFVEKPLALNVSHAEELTQMARKAGKILMVGHLLQYHPAITKLKSLVREGALGKVQYIYSSRLNFGKLRTEENILWSFAPHDISAILFLLGEDPTTVAAHGGNYLNANVADVR